MATATAVREQKRDRDRRYRDRKIVERLANRCYMNGIPGGGFAYVVIGPDGDERPATPREAEALDRQEAEAERKRQEAGPFLTERYGADWLGAIIKEAKMRIRTEVGLEHRLRAQREISDLTERVVRRLNDCAGIGAMPELDTIAAIREFAGATRQEIFAWSGQQDVSGVVGYGPEEPDAADAATA